MKKIVKIFSVFVAIGVIFTAILGFLTYLEDMSDEDSDFDYYSY